MSKSRGSQKTELLPVRTSRRRELELEEPAEKGRGSQKRLSLPVRTSRRQVELEEPAEKVEDDPETTTDEELGEESENRGNEWKSIKFEGETWKDKQTARQLKSFLRDNFKLKNRLFFKDYVSGFIEAALIASKFNDLNDKNRAFDEIMSLFEDWSEFQINQKFIEFSNATLLHILTKIGVPELMSRIFFKTTKFDYLVNNITKEKIKQQRIYLLETKDDLGNVFAHYLMEYISNHPQDGLFIWSMISLDPLWFKLVSDKFKISFQVPNNSNLTALASLDPQIYLHLFEFGSEDFTSFFSKEKEKQGLLEDELIKDTRRLNRLGTLATKNPN